MCVLISVICFTAGTGGIEEGEEGGKVSLLPSRSEGGVEEKCWHSVTLAAKTKIRVMRISTVHMWNRCICNDSEHCLPRFWA